MTRGDRSGHLRPSRVHQQFEMLVAREYGHAELRRRVAPAVPRRPHPRDPATPMAWAAAAASKVATGAAPGSVVAGLGDLGVFCVALGSAAVLAALPAAARERAQRRAGMQTATWIEQELLGLEPWRMAEVRERLEEEDVAALRMSATALLPVVVEAFAEQAPRWWRIRRERFAQLVLYRLAVPDAA